MRVLCLLITIVLSAALANSPSLLLAEDYESQSDLTVNETSRGKLPDLTVTRVEAPNAVRLGKALAVTYVVENKGEASSGPFNVRIYLSSNTRFNRAVDRLLMMKSPWPKGLAAKEKASSTSKILIPLDVRPGKHRLIVVVDLENSVSETTNDNNWEVGPTPVRVARFLDNGNGTVTDLRTKLVWQKADDLKERTWPKAQSYCEDMTLGGRHDWRLPRIEELQTIVDNERFNPTFDPLFSGKPNGYWADSPYAYWPDYAWFIWFRNGDTYTDPKDIEHYVRCVRGKSHWSETPSERLVKVGNAMVKDKAMGLVWQRSDDRQLRTWEEANTYCEELRVGGKDGWRLPSIDELGTLIDYSRYDPTLSEGLFDGHSGFYWSRSSLAGRSDSARGVSFTNGKIRRDRKDTRRYVRCVRETLW